MTFIINDGLLNFNLAMALSKIFSLLITDRLPTTPPLFLGLPGQKVICQY